MYLKRRSNVIPLPLPLPPPTPCDAKGPHIFTPFITILCSLRQCSPIFPRFSSHCPHPCGSRSTPSSGSNRLPIHSFSYYSLLVSSKDMTKPSPSIRHHPLIQPWHSGNLSDYTIRDSVLPFDTKDPSQSFVFKYSETSLYCFIIIPTLISISQYRSY